MIAVGLDPSLTCTGVAVIDTEGGALTRRIVSPNLGTTLLARRERLRRAIAGVLNSVPARVDVTLIEVPNSTKQHGAHGERMALYWWLVDQMFARGPVVEVAPPSRAKLSTGNGRAKKGDVVASLRAAFPNAHIPDDNVADALGLAWAGARWAGIPTPAYLPGQEEAHARLAWPAGTTH
ncbi:crossover junction endodeoxyribonuclease RuvC [Microbacterium sp. CFH 90308]|uniref:Crossover junction endodeoxyribonuclease RuvC n=1 Tax=Microbacterium salsuginis TaxID=2722803 RepID=A0ABX1KB20_9MICO|nr:crossover junction endodeoxyribonuclease RuvC [Microbacterium sp. CFH 90308]NLP82611.1 crossover junction endodeoxyribonuclease RuvC [Microbacterium sp. CFH 90308]